MKFGLKWFMFLFAFVVTVGSVAFSPGGAKAAENGRSDVYPALLHEVPVLSVTNIDLALTRPDQKFDIVVDGKSPLFNRVRQQLENQSFGILFVPDQGEKIFINAKMGQARYEQGIIRVLDHPLFARYTTFKAAVLIKSDYQLAKKGRYPDSITGQGVFTFQTGSDLHEPTKMALAPLDGKPSVMKPLVEITVTDDYGLAGYGEVAVEGKEYGSRMANSLQVNEKTFTLKEADQGKKVVSVEDWEAESVALRFDVKSQYGTKSEYVEMEFQPGPAHQASVMLSDQPLKAGKEAKLSGILTDVYGNPNPNQEMVIDKVGTTKTDGQGNYGMTFTVRKDLQAIRIMADNHPILLMSPNGELVEQLSVKVVVNQIEQKAEKVLLIRDNLAWNYPLWEQAMGTNRIPYDLVNAAQLSTVSFDNYDRIVVVNDQNQNFYNVLQNRMNDLNRWVTNGGILIFEGADMGWTQGQWKVGPGGIGNYLEYNRQNVVVAPNSPFAQNVPGVIYGTYASHNVFVNLPANAQIIMAADPAGTKPTVATFTMGDGFVYVTSQTVEYAVRNSQGAATLWKNVFNYFFMGR